MIYNALANDLRLTADVVHHYISSNLGLAGIQIESFIESSIDYKPTFVVNTRDHHILCVDVSENIYNPTRWHFISECEKKCIPVKLYVALPSISYGGFAQDIKEAKTSSVGILDVDTNHRSCQELNAPLSLSLTGLRNFDKTTFPKKHRELIYQAENLFKGGDPNKACSNIYDEIERVTRSIAVKSYRAGKWKVTLSDPTILENRLAWAKVVLHLRDDLIRNRTSRYHVLSETLISRIHGITSHRNDSGHKPRNKKELIKRDSQLRTRMESAVDLLQELTNAVKSLKV